MDLEEKLTLTDKTLSTQIHLQVVTSAKCSVAKRKLLLELDFCCVAMACSYFVQTLFVSDSAE